MIGILKQLEAKVDELVKQAQAKEKKKEEPNVGRALTLAALLLLVALNSFPYASRRLPFADGFVAWWSDEYSVRSTSFVNTLAIGVLVWHWRNAISFHTTKALLWILQHLHWQCAQTKLKWLGEHCGHAQFFRKQLRIQEQERAKKKEKAEYLGKKYPEYKAADREKVKEFADEKYYERLFDLPSDFDEVEDEGRNGDEDEDEDAITLTSFCSKQLLPKSWERWNQLARRLEEYEGDGYISDTDQRTEKGNTEDS